jgi:uncharacterized membrane protein
MAYREKTAWLTFLCMVVAYSIYFPLIAMRPPGKMFDIILLFGSVASVQAIIVIAGHIVLAVRSRKEAKSPADERDRAIERRGATIGYYVLLTGMILVGVVMPFTETPWKIVNTALLAIVIAELVRHIIVILSYRRGWHG